MIQVGSQTRAYCVVVPSVGSPVNGLPALCLPVKACCLALWWEYPKAFSSPSVQANQLNSHKKAFKLRGRGPPCPPLTCPHSATSCPTPPWVRLVSHVTLSLQGPPLGLSLVHPRPGRQGVGTANLAAQIALWPTPKEVATAVATWPDFLAL